MKFNSLNQSSPPISFRDALFQGMAKDGGLLMPMEISQLPKIPTTASLTEIAFIILKSWIDDIPEDVLLEIIKKTFTFPIPLIHLPNHLFLLELFHGPTLAFKDIGARFMAEAIRYFLQKKQQKIAILVATSGDTGSAVAQGFYQIEGVNVYILYPSERISRLQEQQMTTLGGNIFPIEIKGTFDDCQRLVKQALQDETLQNHCHLTTANSMNVGRLLPQIIYYVWGVVQLQKQGITTAPIVVVPSGNFGNLTAAVIAKAMGANIDYFIAATNSNDVIPYYLSTGHLQPRASHQTLSNAMDVGNPSNFARLQALYQHDLEKIRRAIKATAISDEETLQMIREIYQKTQYITDPHTAVGIAAAKRLVKGEQPILIAATAHPGKFPEVISEALQFDMELPGSLKQVMLKKKISIMMDADYAQWRYYLLEHCRS